MKKKDFIIRTATAAVLITSFCLIFFFMPPIVFSLIICAIFGVIVLIEWPRLFDKKNIFGWLLLPVYPTIPIVFAVLLNHSGPHRMLILFMVLLAATFDSSSYLIGSLFGKHKIAPRISPRKTWEGASGGYLLTCGALGIIFKIVGTQTSFATVVFLSFAICALALTGDLFESWLKRRAGIKDSAHFLPGHGGFLDRLDSIFFLLPFFYLFKNYLAPLFGLFF